MLTSPALYKDTSVPEQFNRSQSPARTLTILICLIFLAEVVAMIVIYYLPLQNYLVETLLDGLIMVALVTPGLFLLQLNPLLKEIGERSRAEQALRANEELLRKVLELLPVGVWITGPDGKIIHGNPATREIWGDTRYVGMDQYGEYKGWWVESRLAVQPEEWAAARAIRRGETVLNDEVEIETFDGQRKLILNSAVPILDDHHTIQGAIIVNQDITRHRHAERELIQRNELLERFFFSISTLIAYMDRDFNFIRVNDTYARSAGHPADFYPGKNHFALFPNAENQVIFRQVVETGEPYITLERPFEYAEFPERGVTYWDWSLQPVKGAGGVVEGLVLSLVDVTERKRADLRLERQNQELRLLTEAERRQRELAEGLVRATITLNSTLELDQVLSSILEQIRKFLPFQGANIVLLEGRTLKLAGFLGFEGYPGTLTHMDQPHTLDDYPLLVQVCASAEPLILPAVSDHPSWRAMPGWEWVRSYAAVPLIAGVEVIGIINLASEQPAAFSQAMVDRLRVFAAPAALALNNARLFEAESAARHAAETLSAAAQELTQTLDLEQVANTLLDHLLRIVPSEVANVALLKDEKELLVVAARGAGISAREEIPTFPHGGITDSVVERALKARKSLVIADILPGAAIGDPSGQRDGLNWLVLPIAASEKAIGLVSLGRARGAVFTLEEAKWAEALVAQAAVAIQNAWLFVQVRSSRERLQFLAHKLVEVQENERYHIARELHDEAGQTLTSLKINLGRLEQDPACPTDFQPRLADLKCVVDGVLEGLHRLAIDLRPAALDRLGLVAALEQYVNNLSSSQLSIQFKAVGISAERLPQDLETSLYRIVQESLTNVIRHAQATQVGILLKQDDGKVMLFVEDDGIGFAPGQVDPGDHLGLVGMRERAEMFGGTLTVESTPGTGTSVIVEIPDAHTNTHRR